VYSDAKKTGIKKVPDITEIGLPGSVDKKLEFAKAHLGKEIFVADILKPLQLVDVRGLTKGKGLSGPVKRFGITFKSHKSEKGVRRPGSLAPWHPHRVTFRAPMAGQLGMFTRVIYNNKILGIGKIHEKNINPSSGFKKYGVIKTDYVILDGSVQGPQKRQVLLTAAMRPTKKQLKKNYELIKVI
jgi:large subunit ribosomal protein L3